MLQLKAEYDSPWKKIFDIYFADFMAYCWPAKYKQIDWSKGYKMLDKELGKITRNALTGNKIVDKLIEIYKKDGEAAYVLLHLEVQGNVEVSFAERMFIYHYRLYDLYRKPIASLAILIDQDKKWRPQIFKKEL